MSSGSLVVVGVGIKVAFHLTMEAKNQIQSAEKVLFIVNDALTADWVQELNPNAEDLSKFYAPDKQRLQTYREIVAYILDAVRAGFKVCFVLYGHPAIFAWPAIEAIRQVREEGLQAEMLAAISATDSLYADLNLDPSRHGCQQYGATDFIIRPRRFDTTAGLILWQIGFVGQLKQPTSKDAFPAIIVLVDELTKHYGDDHNVIIYEAARMPVAPPWISQLSLSEVKNIEIPLNATMYIPPIAEAPIDTQKLERIGLRLADLE